MKGTLSKILGAGLGLLSLTGCGKDNLPAEKPVESAQTNYELKNFGKLEPIEIRAYAGNQIKDYIGITSADFDGDGRPDIAIMDQLGQVYVFKNNIPQAEKK